MKISDAEKNAIANGIIAALMGIVGVAFVGWVVATGRLSPPVTPDQIQQIEVIHYEAGYQAGSRNCLKSYNKAWGE